MLFSWSKRKEVKSSSLQPIDMPGRKVGVAEFMFGDVLTQVWANPAPGGVVLRFTIRKVVKRVPRDEFATGFQLDDLQDVVRGATRVLLWLEENREQISLVTPREFVQQNGRLENSRR
jgi:hypothetical protein